MYVVWFLFLCWCVSIISTNDSSNHRFFFDEQKEFKMLEIDYKMLYSIGDYIVYIGLWKIVLSIEYM